MSGNKSFEQSIRSRSVELKMLSFPFGRHGGGRGDDNHSEILQYQFRKIQINSRQCANFLVACCQYVNFIFKFMENWSDGSRALLDLFRFKVFRIIVELYVFSFDTLIPFQKKTCFQEREAPCQPTAITAGKVLRIPGIFNNL